MSQALEQNTEAKKSSHEDSEYYYESDTELEEGSTASEEDTFLSIRYPSLPYFPTAYLHNWNFGEPDKALKYITKHFNLGAIQDSNPNDEPPHQICSYTLLFSLYLHFLYIVNPPLCTSAPTQLHVIVLVLAQQSHSLRWTDLIYLMDT